MLTHQKLAFVDTLSAIEQARDFGYNSIWSDNPLLAADPHVSLPTENADALVSQDEANNLGALSVDLADAIDDELRSKSPNILPVPQLQLAGSGARVLSVLLYRGLAASRANDLAASERIGVWTANPHFLPSSGYTISDFHNPLASLTKFGFFGNVATEVFVAPARQRRRADADYPSDWLRRVAHLPKDLIIEILKQRVVPKHASSNPKVFVLGENEALRETLPFLTKAGIGYTLLGKVLTQSCIQENLSPSIKLDEKFEQRIAGAIRATSLFKEAECAALSGLMRHWYEEVLNRAKMEWPSIYTFVAERLPKGKSFVLSNGLFGPRGSMVYAALRNRGATVIDFEHGVTTGLSAFSDRSIRHSEASTCDVLFCCSDLAARSFENAAGPCRESIVAIGLADQTRNVYRPRLQRRLARRRFGLYESDTVILHVSTSPYYGNLRPGYGTPTETFVAKTEAALIQNVYARIMHRVIYKPYPAERFAHEPSMSDRLKCPENLLIAPFEDLRYLRAGADVIVTAAPTSTLGWVAGANVPIVWLASRKVRPLANASLDKAFAASFLCVDIDQEGWQDRLVNVLDRPLEEIQSDWKAASGPRSELLERAIFGPSGRAGERAAQLIERMINM